jgi:galactokinase
MVNLEKLLENYKNRFKKNPEYYVDTGGRFELLGNHTDHNHGLCLVANCSLRIRAYVSKEPDIVTIKSSGYNAFKFHVNDVDNPNKKESPTCSLARGILFKLKSLGYQIGGFSCCITSEIPDGSGVSSSAAIESLFGYIISYLYNDGKIPPMVIAQVGQFSENNYFHKPCGLLDQIGTSFPNANFINFKNITQPTVETVKFNLPVTLFLIKSEGNHSNLTPLYAAIPNGMYKVAGLLENKQFLADVYPNGVIDKIENLDIDEDTKKIAIHFFIENANVLKAKKAIEDNDLETFLAEVRASQETSKNNIQNTFVKGEYVGSPQNIVDEVTKFIGQNGAIRIHGGGFKGTTLAFIKNDFADEFEKYLKKNYLGKYYRVHISDSAVNIKKL